MTPADGFMELLLAVKVPLLLLQMGAPQAQGVTSSIHTSSGSNLH
jgi:hypothetical protein